MLLASTKKSTCRHYDVLAYESCFSPKLNALCLTLTAKEDGYSLFHDLEFEISKRQVITMICIPWSDDPVYFEFYHMKWRMSRIHYTLKINSLTFVSVIHTGLYVLALQLLQSGAGMLRRVLESIVLDRH